MARHLEPSHPRRSLLRAAALAAATGMGPATLPQRALAQDTGTALPAELQDLLPDGQALGSARLRFLGLDIYEARLWVRAGFQPAAFAQHRFALCLQYLRALKGTLIAERSLKEMRRQGRLSPAQEQAWLDGLVQTIPDVKAGDRITGLHQPGLPARFWHNGQSRPELADGAFSPVFFGIWLSDATSEPALRERLLGRATP